MMEEDSAHVSLVMLSKGIGAQSWESLYIIIKCYRFVLLVFLVPRLGSAKFLSGLNMIQLTNISTLLHSFPVSSFDNADL